MQVFQFHRQGASGCCSEVILCVSEHNGCVGATDRAKQPLTQFRRTFPRPRSSSEGDRRALLSRRVPQRAASTVPQTNGHQQLCRLWRIAELRKSIPKPSAKSFGSALRRAFKRHSSHSIPRTSWIAIAERTSSSTPSSPAGFGLKLCNSCYAS